MYGNTDYRSAEGGDEYIRDDYYPPSNMAEANMHLGSDDDHMPLGLINSDNTAFQVPFPHLSQNINTSRDATNPQYYQQQQLQQQQLQQQLQNQQQQKQQNIYQQNQQLQLLQEKQLQFQREQQQCQYQQHYQQQNGYQQDASFQFIYQPQFDNSEYFHQSDNGIPYMVDPTYFTEPTMMHNSQEQFYNHQGQQYMASPAGYPLDTLDSLRISGPLAGNGNSGIGYPTQRQQYQPAIRYRYSIGFQNTPENPNIPLPRNNDTPITKDNTYASKLKNNPTLVGRGGSGVAVGTVKGSVGQYINNSESFETSQASSSSGEYDESSDEEIPLATVNMSAKPAEKPAAESPTMKSGSDSDDDTPLSNISIESIKMIRRAKSAAVKSPNLRLYKTNDKNNKLPNIPLGKSQSVSVKPRHNWKMQYSAIDNESESEEEDLPLTQVKKDLQATASTISFGVHDNHGNYTHTQDAQPMHTNDSSPAPSVKSKLSRPPPPPPIPATKVPQDSSETRYYNMVDSDDESENESSSDSDSDEDDVFNYNSRAESVAEPLSHDSNSANNCGSMSSCSSIKQPSRAGSTSTKMSAQSLKSKSSRTESDNPRCKDIVLTTPTKSSVKRDASNYVSGGSRIPMLPNKSRQIDPAAPVRYIALDDIINELNERESPNKSQDDGDSNKLKRHPGSSDSNSLQGNDQSSTKSHNQASDSSDDEMIALLRSAKVEAASTQRDRSGSNAIVGKIVPEDYSNIDALLRDIDEVAKGSARARRRFSLILMRHSLAVDRGLVEPHDYHKETQEDTANEKIEVPEFVPLKVPSISKDTESSLADGLGFYEYMSQSDMSNQAPNTSTEEPAPVVEQEITVDKAPAEESENDIEESNALVADTAGDANSGELTREQKIRKALERLDVMDFRKVSIRIYVNDARRYYTFVLSEFTTCEMILSDMKKSGTIDENKPNWALFELLNQFGIERPLNHFENVMSIVEGWEPKSNNCIIVKGYKLQESLTLSDGVKPGEHGIQGMLYYRVKKNKWQKCMFRLQNHMLMYLKNSSKSKNGKETCYASLTNSDVYTPFEPLRGAPTKFVFGLKSEMAMQMFERPDEDYVKWFAVQSLDALFEWLRIMRLAKNQLKFRSALENRIADSKSTVASTTINNDNNDANNNNSSNNDGKAKLPPLVELPGEPQDTADTGFGADLTTTIGKIASSTKYDPGALVRVVESTGVDVSDFKEVRGEDTEYDMKSHQPVDVEFQPGSLLAKARPAPTSTQNNTAVNDAVIFAKGSLLAQPRESKVAAAVRNANAAAAASFVQMNQEEEFTQGSLLQAAKQARPRPAHVGGAPGLALGSVPQYPLVQLDDTNRDYINAEKINVYTKVEPYRNLISQADAIKANIVHKGGINNYNSNDAPRFGGLLAALETSQQTQQGGYQGYGVQSYQHHY